MTLLSDLYTGGNDVTAAANITTNAIVVGDDGAKGVKAQSGTYCPDYNEADQGVTGNGKSAKAYIDTISTDSASLVFRHSSGAATTTYTFSTSETIPFNINIIIEKGAILSIATAQTLTINGPFGAGLYQAFSGAGSVAFGNGAVLEDYPEWWGIDGTADDVQIQKAIDTFIGNGVVKFSNRTYNTTAKISGKSYVSLKGCGEFATYINGAHTGAAIVSFKGVTHSGIEDMTLEGDSGTTPKTGLVLGRASASSAGYHYFKSLTIKGYYSVAALYSIASEENVYMKCFILLQGGTAKYAYYTSQSDSLSVETLTGSTNWVNRFYGCAIYNWSEAVANMSTVYIQGGQSTGLIAFRDCFFCAAKDAFITIDAGTVDASDIPGPIIFDSCGGEKLGTSESTVNYGFLLTSTGARTINKLDLQNRAFFSGMALYGVYSNDSITLTKFSMSDDAGFDISLYNVTNSDINLSNSDITIRGTSYGNRYLYAPAKTLSIAVSRADIIDLIGGTGFEELCLSEGKWLKAIDTASYAKSNIFNVDTNNSFLQFNDGLKQFGIVKRSSAKTAAYNVTATESGMIYSNTGAGGAIEFDLPAATVGLNYIIVRTAAQTVTIDPNGTEVIRGGAAGKNLSLDANGTIVELYCAVAGIWDWIARGTTSHEA